MKYPKHHFQIYRYDPKELLFDGEMTFPEAHQYMDEHASFLRRVSYEVFNESINKWEDFKDTYFGNRKVYDKKGELYILNPDYQSMWRPQYCQWYIWEVSKGRRFISCHKSEDDAKKRCAFLQDWNECNENKPKFIYEKSDVEYLCSQNHLT